MLTPTLETARVQMRPLTAADAETVYAAWASDPEVTRYMRYNTHTSVQDTLEWLSSEEANASKDTYYNWGLVLKESGALFGSGGIAETDGVFMLGYNIARPYWGLGLMTEAARGMLEFAVETLGAREFFAYHAKENPASGRVLEKLGFVYRQDGEFVSLDGARAYPSREYTLSVPARR
ncbi:MAG: GNAT family N-acetyltransferase [Oscillospiraceae bacterium]|nr:GNAT family N-acetyltransferase [Oscillospiraceae bacterium]